MDGDDDYFIHSYYASGVPEEFILASYLFGKTEIPAIVRNENILDVNSTLKKVLNKGLNIIDHFLKELNEK